MLNNLFMRIRNSETNYSDELLVRYLLAAMTILGIMCGVLLGIVMGAVR